MQLVVVTDASGAVEKEIPVDLWDKFRQAGWTMAVQYKEDVAPELLPKKALTDRQLANKRNRSDTSIPNFGKYK